MGSTGFPHWATHTIRNDMTQATNIPALFASKPKEFSNPAQLIAPRTHDSSDFDQFLDAEVSRPHLDRTQRSARREESQNNTETQFTSKADRRTEARDRVAPNNPDTKVSERTPLAPSDQKEVPVVKASTPQTKVTAANDPASPEQKLVRALKDLGLEQERIDHVLNVLKQGPDSDSVIDALANLIVAVNGAGQNPIQQLASAQEGDENSPLSALKALFLEGSEHAQAAHTLTEKQQKLLDTLVSAGLTKEQAQNLLSAARSGSLAQGTDAIRQQLNQSASQLAAKEVPEADFSLAGAKDKAAPTGLENKISDNGPRITAGLENGLNKLASLSNGTSQEGAQQNLNGNGGGFRPGGLAAMGLSLNGNAAAPAQGATAEAPVAQAVSANSDTSVKVSEVFKPAVAETYNPRGSVEKPIAQQIIDKFSLRGAGANKEIQIRLDPPSLGTVRMNVSSNGESVKTTIVAENQMVKQTIENNLSQLKDSMNSQGLKVDSFTVLVGGDSNNGMAHQQQEARSAVRFFGSQHHLPVEGMAEAMPQRQPVFFSESQSISLFA